MSPFLLFLHDKQTPGWAMLKNAKITSDQSEGYRIASFEEALWSDSISQLREHIPKPQLLTTREAKELIQFRYSEDEIGSGDFKFDDLPSSLLNETCDLELFGSCYPVFWVVSPDKETVIESILDKLSRETVDKISADQIKQLWDDYLNRIFFKHDGTEEFIDLALLHEELVAELIERINNLPCAPLEASWEVLNEPIDWEDDEA
jgi:hypothetical protein